MKDFKILWLGKNDMYKMASYGLYLRQEMARHAEVSTYGIGWGHPDIPIKQLWRRKETDILKLVDIFKPDYIFIDLYWNWENLDKVDIPKTIFWGDPHEDAFNRIEWVTKNKVTGLMPFVGIYPRAGLQWYRERLPDHIKLKYFPMWVDTNVFKDYGYERDIDLCLLGRCGVRPFRAKVYNYYKDNGGEAGENYKVFYYRRPKRNWLWSDEKLKEMGYVARESYAKLIARCKGYPMPVGACKYTVAKFFEAPAAKTLIFSNTPGGADRLHFIPDKTFVEINLDNWKEKIDYYLENESERNKIIEAAYKNIHKHHTVKIRVQELFDYVENELM